jgi:hypothetical protein
MRFATTLTALVVSGLLLAACGDETTSTDEAATADPALDSLPFADDGATSTDGDLASLDTDADADSPSDEELFSDDEIPAPDVTPDEPLSDTEVAALLATVDAAAEPDTTTDSAEEIVVGVSTDDATHVGIFGVTAEHLMRELTLAYGGQAEMLGEPARSADGGSFSFALTAVAIADADANRVDVEFSYVTDPDQPDMIVGHRADRITLTPFDLDG